MSQVPALENELDKKSLARIYAKRGLADKITARPGGKARRSARQVTAADILLHEDSYRP